MAEIVNDDGFQILQLSPVVGISNYLHTLCGYLYTIFKDYFEKLQQYKPFIKRSSDFFENYMYIWLTSHVKHVYLAVTIVNLQ